MMTAYKHKKTMLEMMVVKVFNGVLHNVSSHILEDLAVDYYKAYINVSPPPE